jgi:hypothetical protein
MATFPNAQHKLRNQLIPISTTNKLHVSDVLFLDSGDWLSLSVIAVYLKQFTMSVLLFIADHNGRAV